MRRVVPTRVDQIPLRNGRLMTLAEFDPNGVRPADDIAIYHRVVEAFGNLGMLGQDGLTITKPGKLPLG